MVIALWMVTVGLGALTAQAPRYLRGKVYHEKTGRVLAGVSVKVSGGDAKVTDREGYFALDLSIGDKGTPGSLLSIYLLDPMLGNDMREIIVPADRDKDIRLEFRSDRYILVSGTIRDKASQGLLKGIMVQVAPEIQGLKVEPLKPVYTDETGNFLVCLDREIYGVVSHVRLTAHDLEGNRYFDYVGTEQARSGIEIGLEPIMQSWISGRPTPGTGAGGRTQDPNSGTICIKNMRNKTIWVHVRPWVGAFQLGMEIQTQIGPGEEPCFEGFPAKQYCIISVGEDEDISKEQWYYITLQPGTTQKTLIR